MTNPSPDLIRQVEAESVAHDHELKMPMNDFRHAERLGEQHMRAQAIFARIDSIITARVAAATQQAYEAGRLAASPAAPAGQLDASLAKLREVATWIDSQCNQQQISAEEFCYPTQFDYDLAQAASELFALATEIEQTGMAGSACQGGNTNPIDTLSASQAAPAKAESCTWSLSDEESGTWASSCGELWSFIDGGPQENRVSFCHHCGGKVTISIPAKEPT